MDRVGDQIFRSGKGVTRDHQRRLGCTTGEFFPVATKIDCDWQVPNTISPS